MRRKGKKEHYYLVMGKDGFNPELFITKTQVAQYVGVSTSTLIRYFRKSDKYEGEHYDVWQNVRVNRLKVGFAVRNRGY